MTTYRRFTVTRTPTLSKIQEIEPTTKHPINWTGVPQACTREGAWKAAQAAYLPCEITTRDGKVINLTADQTFNPAIFEDTMYAGYVGYGYSMSDGYYAPIKHDAWVKDFRRSVLDTQDPNFGYQMLHNDAHASVAGSLPHYQLMLRASVQGHQGRRARQYLDAERASKH